MFNGRGTEDTPPMQSLPRLEDLAVENRRVFVRADLDPLVADLGAEDDPSLHAALPTLRHLLAAGARVVVGAHLGEPDAEPAAIDDVAAWLAERLDAEVRMPDEVRGDGVAKLVADLRPGGLVVLPNLFLDPGEATNDPKFAQALANMTDAYVNDALSASSQPWASVATLPRLVPHVAAGLRLRTELDALNALEHPESPCVAIVGGSPWEVHREALGPLIERLRNGDHVLAAGETALLLLATQSGGSVGGCTPTTAQRREADRILAKAQARGVQVWLPIDVVAAGTEAGDRGAVFPAAQELPPHHRVLDIGPQTVVRAAALIATARTVWWHGAVGHTEDPAFAAGTNALARAVAEAPGRTWVQGRTAVGAVARLGLLSRVDHPLTGDATALAAIQGKPLIGISTITRKEEA